MVSRHTYQYRTRAILEPSQAFFCAGRNPTWLLQQAVLELVLPACSHLQTRFCHLPRSTTHLRWLVLCMYGKSKKHHTATAIKKNLVQDCLALHDYTTEEAQSTHRFLVLTKQHTPSVSLTQMAIVIDQPPPLDMQQPPLSSALDFDLDFFHEVSDDFTIDESPDPPNRKVGFNDQVNVIPSVSPLDVIDASQFGDLWYGMMELDDFRTEVRELCRSMRTHCTQGPDAKVCTCAPSYHQRGLEQRSCLERQRRKYLTLKCVVRGQHGLDDEHLASLSLRCTKWAAELAVEEAARDFVHAYYEEQPSETVKRTTMDEIIVETRRVRPRLAFPAEHV